MWKIFQIFRKKMINFIIFFLDFGVGIFSLCHDDEKFTTKIVNLFHCVTIMILNVLHEVDISCTCCKKKNAQQDIKEIDASDEHEFIRRADLMAKDVLILRKGKLGTEPKYVDMSNKMKLNYKEWKALLEEENK